MNFIEKRREKRNAAARKQKRSRGLIKTLFIHPLMFLFLVLLGLYAVSEFFVRGEAMNAVSNNTLGWIFYGGLAVLFFYEIVLPVFTISMLPNLDDPRYRRSDAAHAAFFRRAAKRLVRRFSKNAPEAIAGDLESVKGCLHDRDDRRSAGELERLLPKIYEGLSEECSRIIRKNMLRALIFTAVSQIGLIDAACLLYLQFRTVRDICRLLGYRPSFLFLTYCYLWIFANSFLFALLDESVDLTEMMPDALTLGAGKFSRKLFGAFVQGITSAALVYVTGEILKRRLLRGKKKISAKERLFIRLAGIKATMELVPSMIWDKVRDSFTGLFPKFFA